MALLPPALFEKRQARGAVFRHRYGAGEYWLSLYCGPFAPSINLPRIKIPQEKQLYSNF